MARRYATSTERGVGHAHAKDKIRLEAILQDGEPCWRCGQPMYKWQKLDRDHIVDRALGGVDGPAVLSHASCNRSAGGRLRNQLYPGASNAFRAPPATCHTCGKTYTRHAQACDICGVHFHPTYGAPGEQRTCGRVCGLELKRRNKRAAGWVPMTTAERQKRDRERHTRYRQEAAVQRIRPVVVAKNALELLDDPVQLRQAARNWRTSRQW